MPVVLLRRGGRYDHRQQLRRAEGRREEPGQPGHPPGRGHRDYLGDPRIAGRQDRRSREKADRGRGLPALRGSERRRQRPHLQGRHVRGRRQWRRRLRRIGRQGDVRGRHIPEQPVHGQRGGPQRLRRGHALRNGGLRPQHRGGQRRSRLPGRGGRGVPRGRPLREQHGQERRGRGPERLLGIPSHLQRQCVLRKPCDGKRRGPPYPRQRGGRLQRGPGIRRQQRGRRRRHLDGIPRLRLRQDPDLHGEHGYGQGRRALR